MKVRRVDLWPDEFLAAVCGEMEPADLGVYFMICLMIYSRGEAIPADIEMLRGKFKKTDMRVVKNALDRLQSSGRLVVSDGQFVVNRCLSELQRAAKRIANNPQNGRKGGRPLKDNNNLENPSGSFSETLTTNYQLPTNNQQPKESPPIAPRKRRASDLEGFDEFYKAFPRHVGVGHAEKAYGRAVATADAAAILAGAQRYAAAVAGKDQQFVKHPATWLNAKGWLDELPAASGVAALPLERSATADDHVIALAAKGIRTLGLSPALIRDGIRSGRIGADAARNLGHQADYLAAHREEVPA